MNRNALQQPMTVEQDDAPSVDAKKQGIGSKITSLARIPLGIQARDKYGLAEMRVTYLARAGMTTGAEAASQPAVQYDPVTMTQTNLTDFRTEHVLDIQGKDFKPGYYLDVRVEARDRLPEDFGGPNVGRSGLLTFQIVPESELWDDLLARRKHHAIELENAISFQNQAAAKTLAGIELLDAGDAAGCGQKFDESSTLQGTVHTECSKVLDGLRSVLPEMENNRIGKPEQRANDRSIVDGLDAIIAEVTVLRATMNDTRAGGELAKKRDALLEIKAKQDEFLNRIQELHKLLEEYRTRQELASTLRRLKDRWEEWLRRAEEEKRKKEAERLRPGTTTQPAEPGGNP
jgi:hypothetical protein